MYAKLSIGDLDARDIEGVEPDLKAVGYELRPKKMRPSLWIFEAGESTNRHYQREQEELYLVLDGRFEMRVGDETLDLSEGDVVVVEPSAVRQLTALETGTVFAVGAPNVKDDAVDVEEDDAEGGDGAHAGN